MLDITFTVQQRYENTEWDSYPYHTEPYIDLALAEKHVQKSKEKDKEFYSKFRYFRILKKTMTTITEVIS